MTFRRASLLLVSLATLLLAAEVTAGQQSTRRLRSPATVRGFVGGEAHDSYVIRARKGQTMTVRLSWRHEHDNAQVANHAEFFVGDLPNFDADGLVRFGKESKKGKGWSGKIPKTGNYYIYVLANPTAHYTLRVSVR